MRDGPLPGQWGSESVRWELPYGALIQIDVTPIPVTVYVSDAEGIARMRGSACTIAYYTRSSMRATRPTFRCLCRRTIYA